MGNPREPLTFETTFHVYNHAVGDDRFFREEGNYHFFINRFIKYVLPVTEVLAFSLIPDHFHFVLRIRSYEELKMKFRQKIDFRMSRPSHTLDMVSTLEKIVNEKFSHCFNSYAQSYNKRYDRIGSLFKESFQRRVIDSEEYLKDVICYVHNNAIHHGMVNDASKWKHSSYNDLFTNAPTIINRKEVIGIFGTLENLEYVHRLHARLSLLEFFPDLHVSP